MLETPKAFTPEMEREQKQGKGWQEELKQKGVTTYSSPRQWEISRTWLDHVSIDYPPQRRSRSHVAPKDLAPDKGENIVSAIVKTMDGQKTAKNHDIL